MQEKVEINLLGLVELFEDNNLLGDNYLFKLVYAHGIPHYVFEYNSTSNKVRIEMPNGVSDEDILESISFEGITGKTAKSIIDCLLKNKSEWLISKDFVIAEKLNQLERKLKKE